MVWKTHFYHFVYGCTWRLITSLSIKQGYVPAFEFMDIVMCHSFMNIGWSLLTNKLPCEHFIINDLSIFTIQTLYKEFIVIVTSSFILFWKHEKPFIHTQSLDNRWLLQNHLQLTARDIVTLDMCSWNVLPENYFFQSLKLVHSIYQSSIVIYMLKHIIIRRDYFRKADMLRERQNKSIVIA